MRFIDLSGKTFGKLTVIERLTKQTGRTIKWVCKCECGNKINVTRSNLKSGNVKSCGNHNSEDLTNKKFGRLKVIKRGKGYFWKDKIYSSWICLCDCGQTKDIYASQLKSGKTRSCGCLAKEKIRERSFTGFEDITGKYWSTVLNGAKRRNLDFNITKEYIWRLYLSQNKKCALSNVNIQFKNIQTASIDRIDNDKGYVVGNIQILHKIVNIMKNNMTQTQFVEWCSLISSNKRNDNLFL